MSALTRWLRSVRARLDAWRRRRRAPGRFLCDGCRYDYGDACRRRERPNALHCDDYRPR